MNKQQEFLASVKVARELVQERLMSLSKGEQSFGTKDELRWFLENLDVAEEEAKTGKFRYPKGERRLESSHAVGDHWPFKDAVGLAIAHVGALYLDL